MCSAFFNSIKGVPVSRDPSHPTEKRTELRSFRELFPFTLWQFDDLAAHAFQVACTVIIIPVFCSTRHSVIQTEPAEVATLNQVLKNVLSFSICQAKLFGSERNHLDDIAS